MRKQGPNRRGGGSNSGTPRNGGSPMDKPNSFSRGGPNSQPNKLAGDAYDITCRDRFIGIAKSMVGERVEVQMKDGSTHEGIFHTCTPFRDCKFQIVLRGVRVVPQGQAEQDGVHDAYLQTVHLDAADMVQLQARHFPVQERRRPVGFATDTKISGKPQPGRMRELEHVDSSWVAPSPRSGSGGQDAGGLRSSGGKKWDQFEANKRLFNVTSSYDENLYTTPLDKSSLSAEKQRHADRMAREIESRSSSNIHLREERNQLREQDYADDEEARYSGVVGTGGLASADAAPANSRSSSLNSTPKTTGQKTLSAEEGGPAYKPPAMRSRKAADQELRDVLQGKHSANATPEDSEGTGSLPASPAKGVDADASASAQEDGTKASDGSESPSAAQSSASASASAASGKPKSKLNPKAKEFKLSAKAKEWKPSFTPPPTPPVALQQQQQQQQMMRMQYPEGDEAMMMQQYPGMPMGMGAPQGMMPGMAQPAGQVPQVPGQMAGRPGAGFSPTPAGALYARQQHVLALQPQMMYPQQGPGGPSLNPQRQMMLQAQLMGGQRQAYGYGNQMHLAQGMSPMYQAPGFGAGSMGSIAVAGAGFTPQGQAIAGQHGPGQAGGGAGADQAAASPSGDGSGETATGGAGSGAAAGDGTAAASGSGGGGGPGPSGAGAGAGGSGPSGSSGRGGGGGRGRGEGRGRGRGRGGSSKSNREG
ncbi:unnamed protein product [Chrysoparadoxa australica]